MKRISALYMQVILVCMVLLSSIMEIITVSSMQLVNSVNLAILLESLKKKKLWFACMKRKSMD